VRGLSQLDSWDPERVAGDCSLHLEVQPQVQPLSPTQRTLNDRCERLLEVKTDLFGPHPIVTSLLSLLQRRRWREWKRPYPTSEQRSSTAQSSVPYHRAFNEGESGETSSESRGEKRAVNWRSRSRSRVIDGTSSKLLSTLSIRAEGRREQSTGEAAQDRE
jgi:hypothetical protein